ncbi:MAG TPA: hypothetical protein VHO69_08470 [Phototrophicaceae bacterium]|nr:hypothetical protein [Phototrophicaceae bacterium]
MMSAKIKRDDTHPFVYELVQGEDLLWLGQPDASKLFAAYDLFYIPFSLMWGGFALFWNLGVWSSESPFFFRLWGLPFLAVGFYIIIGRFFYKWWRKRHTHYAVTNKRLFILTTGLRYNLQSFSLNDLPELTKSVGRDGFGTITFTKAPGWSFGRRNQMNMSNSGMEFFGYALPGFYDIPNANDVYALINDLRFSSSNR